MLAIKFLLLILYVNFAVLLVLEKSPDIWNRKEIEN